MQNGHDAPITTQSEDLLNGYGVALAIHRTITSAPPNWSTRVGLFGSWGSGKTSILNMLRGLEEQNGSLVISFSAWSASGEDGVISQFYSALEDKLKELGTKAPLPQRARKLAGRLLGWTTVGRVVRGGIEEWSPAPATVTKAALETVSGLTSRASAWTKIGAKDLEAIMTLTDGRRVVVFIDDLDRADPRLVPKTLLALRELLDWPGFAFVLAVDRRAVSSALSEYSKAFGDDAQGFLEKVIDISFDVPTPDKTDKLRLSRAVFAACCSQFPIETLTYLHSSLPTQPRRIKLIGRVFGAMQSVLARHDTESVDWTGLLLYSILNEANAALAHWAVQQRVGHQEGDFNLFSGNEKEQEASAANAKAGVMAILANPKVPDDADRVANVAIDLIRHWAYTSRGNINYWIRLFQSEPPFTARELRLVQEEYLRTKDLSSISRAIVEGAELARQLVPEAATEVLGAFIGMYGAELDAMAESRTDATWNKHLSNANEMLSMLGALWQSDDPTFFGPLRSALLTTQLFGVASTWVGWTRNAGEPELRRREQNLALHAARECGDPEHLYAQTDPFQNFVAFDTTDATQKWRGRVREVIERDVVARLCERFSRPNGMREVASGDHGLGAWLVENKQSPLYSNRAHTEMLVDALKSEADASEATSDRHKAANAELYLRQILFKTRQASWGGDHARAIHEQHPDIVPAAWESVTRRRVPFRMLSSIRDLRTELLSVGVESELLPQPTWLEAARS